MYFFAKNWARVESSLCFSSSSFLEFALEMLRASSSESRDFQVLQSTSQDSSSSRDSVTTLIEMYQVVSISGQEVKRSDFVRVQAESLPEW